jgi:hypothetical protein
MGGAENVINGKYLEGFASSGADSRKDVRVRPDGLWAADPSSSTRLIRRLPPVPPE